MGVPILNAETILVTELPKKESVSETFDAVTVVSRSGLHPAERLLLSHLADLADANGPLLVAGNRTGATAMLAALAFPSRPVTIHAFDLHHARAILRNFTRNAFAVAFAHDPGVTCAFQSTNIPSGARQLPPIRVACTASVPAAVPEGYASAVFMTSSADMTGELILDQLEDIHTALAPGGVCLFSYSGDPESVLTHFRKLFGKINVLTRTVKSILLRGVKREPLAQRRLFRATFPASLPGFAPVTLASFPGVFCHRRPDNGGLALAEVAVREMKDGLRLVDIGCGCGLVGLLLAAAHPVADLLLLDSSARALAAARANAEALKIPHVRLLLSDDGTEETGFDRAVGNPPYFSDYKIADSFIAGASDALAPDGIGFLVAKTTAELEEHLRAARFEDISVIPRRGYKVIRFA